MGGNNYSRSYRQLINWCGSCSGVDIREMARYCRVVLATWLHYTLCRAIGPYSLCDWAMFVEPS